MPIVAFINDKLDYKALKYEIYDVSDDLVRQIALRKGLPIEVVLYKKKLYQRLMEIKSLSFCGLYRVFLVNLHPFISIFTKFDSELKRLVR